MPFNKAERLKAAAIVAAIPGSKTYKPPKVKRRPKKKGPHTLVRHVPLRKGALTEAEHIAVKALVTSVEPGETEQQLHQRGRALGIALRRSPEAITNAIRAASEEMAADAPTYVKLLLKSAKKAAQRGDSRPIEWALENISAKDEKGKAVRVVDPPKTADNGPRMPVVNIMIPMGGIAPGASLTPRPSVSVIDVDPEDGS